MADKDAPVSFIQNSMSAGELSPDLYGRTDLAKYHQGCMQMKNWFVNYRGGATTRPGTQYIGQPGSTGYARLWPFKFSTAVGQTYMLVFSNLKVRFIKNPGGNTYPNGSNSGFILSGGVPYEVATPYVTADLPYLKFVQVGDQLTITRRGYTRRVLSRLADTNWTLTTLGTGPPFATVPTINNVTISPLPAGSTDPQKTRYMYAVSAVDADGNESPPSIPYITPSAGIDIAATQGTVTIFFSPVANAVYYKVYKALPAPGDKVPSQAQEFGLAGFSYGTIFLDSNIVADFAKAPLTVGDPFAPGQITGFTITASSSDWPVAGTNITVTGGGGSGALIYAILDNNTAGGTGAITGLYIANPGSGYTSAPTLAATGGGTTFTAIAAIGPTSGTDPDVVGLFQQRKVYASSSNRPSTVFASRPGKFQDFRVTNPTNDGDAYSLDIAAQQINTITWMQPMPGGLVLGTDAGVLQLTGGSSSASNPTAVTGSSAVLVPQSYYGTSDVHPIVIDYDILYVQLEASIVRDLQYNFFVNIYTGTDVTVLSSHLFYPHTIVDWAYQDTPNKVIWAVRNDGVLLSLTFLKAQEILGWAQHETLGLVESVAVVQEGAVDAVYISVNRGNVRFVERLADHQFDQIDDSWCLDAALSTGTTWPAAAIQLTGATGNVNVTADAPVFAVGDVGKTIRVAGGKGHIGDFINSQLVTMRIDNDYPFPLRLGSYSYANGGWRMDSNVVSVSGLSHLNGYEVFALVDGLVQGPFIVSGGNINLTTPGSSVVVGLKYTCTLQPLFFDPGGEATIQGRRGRNVATTLRVKDAARLKFGTKSSTVREFVQGLSSTDPPEELPYIPSKMMTGDIRMVLDPIFDRIKSVTVVQDLPLPATVLAIIPEEVQGDTR